MPTVRSYQRDVFLSRVWRYQQGEHVTLIAPTGGGKTYLAQQLLDGTVRPEAPAVTLVMKPRDKEARKLARRPEWRRVRSWPPPPGQRLWRPSTAGYVLWPKHSFDPDVDEPAHYQIFRQALLHSYKKGGRVIFADELYSLVHELGLRRELVTLWTKGRSMGTGLWGATQRPRDVPLHAYSQAEHLFLAYDPDASARERYAEIGGVDPRIISGTTSQLPQYWWLYIRRADRTMCVIEK